jgi:endonuclease G
MDFYTNDSVKTSDGKDYEANVWDKGHCAPAADFNCTRETLWQTFSYLNCILQHEKLNRGAWRLLEAYERQLALKGKVTVQIDVIYAKNAGKLPTGATIRTAFRKTINFDNKKEIYYFVNEAPSSNDFKLYLIK